jgi:hypothetical protein
MPAQGNSFLHHHSCAQVQTAAPGRIRPVIKDQGSSKLYIVVCLFQELDIPIEQPVEVPCVRTARGHAVQIESIFVARVPIVR